MASIIVRRYKIDLWAMAGAISLLVSQCAFAQYQYAAWPPEVQPITNPYANAGRLLNETGRFLGVGYSEGYHACPSCSSGSCSTHGSCRNQYPQLTTHLHPRLQGKNIVGNAVPACSRCGKATGCGPQGCSGSCQTGLGHSQAGHYPVGSASPFFWRSNVRYFHPTVAIPSKAAMPTEGYVPTHEHAIPVEGYSQDHTRSPSDRGSDAGAVPNFPWQNSLPQGEAGQAALGELPNAQAPVPTQQRIPQAVQQRSRETVPQAIDASQQVRPSPVPALTAPVPQAPSRTTPNAAGGSGNLLPPVASPIPRPPVPGKKSTDSEESLLDEGESESEGRKKEISLLEQSDESAAADDLIDISPENSQALEAETKKEVAPSPAPNPPPPPALNPPPTLNPPPAPKAPEVRPSVQPSKESEKIPADEDLLSRRRNVIRQPTRR